MKRSPLLRLHPFKLSLLALLAAGSTASAHDFNPGHTSVQMFRWKWNDIARECTHWLGPRGFGAVQVSPPHAHPDLAQWFDIYQPVNFEHLKGDMGTEAELAAMIGACHGAGVRVYVDVAIQHMASGAGVATDGSAWDARSLRYPDFGPQDFHPKCPIVRDDYGTPGNRSHVLTCRLAGLPDLDTARPHVRRSMGRFLEKLRAMGVDGIRIDTAKHLPAADIGAMLAGVERTTTSGEPFWVTQEVRPDGNLERAEYLVNGTINEFRFTHMLRDMLRRTNGAVLSEVRTYMGTPGNWGGTHQFVPSDKAVVFINNWDTERTVRDSLNASNDTGELNDTKGTRRYHIANIFMLAWPYGHAQLHSGYRFTDKDAGSPAAAPFDADGKPVLNGQWDFIHRWPELANLVKFRSYTHGAGVDRFTQGNDNQIAFSRGAKGFVAINNDGAPWQARIKAMLPAGSYCDIVSGRLEGGRCSGNKIQVDRQGYVRIALAANDGTAMPALVLQADQREPAAKRQESAR